MSKDFWFNLSWMIDNLSNTVSSIYSKYYSEYPIFAFQQNVFAKNIKLKKADFIKDINEVYGKDINIIDLMHSFNQLIVKHPEFLIVIETFGKDEAKKHVMSIFLSWIFGDNIIKLNDLVKKYSSWNKTEVMAEIHNIFLNTQKEIKQSTNFKYASEFDYVLSDLYPWIQVEKMFDSYAKSRENIFILIGDPWVGKTSLIKYMMKYFIGREDDIYADYNIAYTKDERLVEEDSFWWMLQDNGYKLLILDDFDNGLTPREDFPEWNPFVSKLLSFSDGIFDNNVKIIITTNKNIDLIDKAIVRPGRCFDILKLRKLKTDEARFIWINKLKLDSNLFEEKFWNTEEIAQALLMSEANILSTEENTNYLIEKELSVKKQFEQWYMKKKAGFIVD